jgi:hypothetical protein
MSKEKGHNFSRLLGFFHKDGKSFATSLLGENKIRVSPAFEENSGIIVIL